MTEVTKNAAEITNEAIEVMINNAEKESTTIMDDIVKAAIEENEEILRKRKIDEAKNILSTRAYEKLSTELLKQITELKNKFIETGDADTKKKITEIRNTYNAKLKDLRDKFDGNFSTVDWGF